MNKDRAKIARIFRAFKMELMDIDKSIDEILYIYKESMRFNKTNFVMGVYVGATITFILLWFFR
jgi:hypothetical protein